MRSWLKKSLIAATFVFLLPALVWAEASLPEQPVGPSGEPWYVLDEAEVLSAEVELALQYQLASLVEETSTAFVVVTLDTLDNYPIEKYALELGREWGVGQDEFDNGLVFLVVVEDREMRIEVGRGLEGVIPDASAWRVIDEIATPAFVEGNYERGIMDGVTVLETLARGEAYSWEEAEYDPTLGDLSGAAAVFLFVFMPFIWALFSWFSGSKGWWAGGFFGGIFGFIVAGIAGLILVGLIGLLLDYALSKYFYKKIKLKDGFRVFWGGRGGGGNGDGDGGSGGGFSGFGGGGFGGGGASGRW